MATTKIFRGKVHGVEFNEIHDELDANEVIIEMRIRGELIGEIVYDDDGEPNFIYLGDGIFRNGGNMLNSVKGGGEKHD